jgi:hypothetical protein
MGEVGCPPEVLLGCYLLQRGATDALKRYAGVEEKNSRFAYRSSPLRTYNRPGLEAAKLYERQLRR